MSRPGLSIARGLIKSTIFMLHEAVSYIQRRMVRLSFILPFLKGEIGLSKNGLYRKGYIKANKIGRDAKKGGFHNKGEWKCLKGNIIEINLQKIKDYFICRHISYYVYISRQK